MKIHRKMRLKVHGKKPLNKSTMISEVLISGVQYVAQNQALRLKAKH